MDLCLDMLARTSPAPLGAFRPWSCTPASLFFPHIFLPPTEALAVRGGQTPQPGSPFPAPSSSAGHAIKSCFALFLSPYADLNPFFPGV